MNRISLILRQKFFSIIFIILAILGGIFIFWYIGNLKSQISENIEYREIFIARDFIEKGEEITKDLIERQKLPKNIFSGKFILDESQILGKKTLEDILEGEIISGEKIEGINLDSDSRLGFSYYIPKDLRAVSILVNYYGNRKLIREGDRVDVISTYYDQSEGILKSETILYEKEIVNIGDASNNDSYMSDEKDFFLDSMFASNLHGNSLGNFLILTFYLNPQEAEKIFLGLEKGTLNISICNQGRYKN